ncbi:MAG: hypothetical protein M1839_005622 [Geoglossum umbratile]|nr:MAG: hypothetical protein M1839_005622 [Geoglossum umbratile]
MSQTAEPSKDERSSRGLFLQLDLGHMPNVPLSTRHRRQRSLEMILNFNHVDLTPAERERAVEIFNQVLKASAPVADPPPPYDAVNLLRLSLEENPSERGKDNFLNYMLRNYDHTEDDTDLQPFSQVLDRLEQTVPK